MAKRPNNPTYTIPQNATLASGAEWRKQREQGIPVWLPFGEKLVHMRVVRPDHLLAQGSIPDVLTNLVVDMLYGKAGSEEVDAFLAPRERADEALAMMESLRVVCTAALVSPRIVSEPLADDEISIDDVEIADRGYIFRLVFLPAEALARFRYKSTADVEPVANLEGDAQPTV